MELISMVATLSSLFIAGANCAIFIIIKFNDMKHISISITEIKSTLLTIDKKLDNTSERLSKQEGKCLANHG